MPGIKKEGTRLGDNIRGLRKMWGETQLDLAIAIGLDNGTTISNYENGRTPERDILIKIAKHYRITENELLNGNYKNAKPLRAIRLGVNEEIKELLKRCFPMFSSQEALENQYFKQAHEIHERLWRIMEGDNYSEIDALVADYRKCIESYKKASDEKVLEATANYMSLLAIVGSILGLGNQELMEAFDFASESPTPPTNIEFMRDNGYLPSFFEENYNDNDDEVKIIKKQFLELYEVDFFVGIVILKRSQEYRDLGDYYFALRYVCNILSNTNMSPEMYSAIGYELLYAYGIMHNKYARAFTLNKETKK